KTKKKAKHARPIRDLHSADESGGQSAVRGVNKHEKERGARPGPANHSLQPFHEPVPI
ncbi:hypothetical protein BDN72DRAFT_738844, partial [Pluteus cervinus]